MPFPGWLYCTPQEAVLLVIVIVAEPVADPPEQPPVVVMVTGRPELAPAATSKLTPYAAVGGAGVVTLIVWLPVEIVKVAPAFVIV